MEDRISKLLKRFKKAESRKSNWENLYEDAQCYVAPHREAFNEADINPGEYKDGKGVVYDSTAVDAVQKFASNLQSSLTPPMRKWIELKPGAEFKGNKELGEQLNNITDIMFSKLASSNFDTQISECYQDLAIGTGALLVMRGDKNRPFNFVNVPLSQMYLEEGPNGVIETAFRCWNMPARNIEATWPEADIHKDLAECVAEKPDELIKVIEMTYPDEVEITTPEGTQKVNGFRYIVIDEKHHKILFETQQRSSPWVVFRWSTLPGEIYGRGPVTFALPDIKTLNKTKELLLKSASIAIFGMWTAVDDGTMNIENIKFGPGIILPVTANEGSMQGPSIAPLRTPGEPNLAQIIIQDLQNTIRNMLFADPLGPIDLPVKTATEISIRQQELAKRIGSAFGRLQYELISPLVNRLLDILDEVGLIELGDFRVDGSTIAIEHVSPLAQAQGEEEVVAISRYMELIAGMYGPEALGLAMPIEKFVKEVAPKLNIPAGLVPSEEEIQQKQQAQAMAMAAMQAQQG